MRGYRTVAPKQLCCLGYRLRSSLPGGTSILRGTDDAGKGE